MSQAAAISRMAWPQWASLRFTFGRARKSALIWGWAFTLVTVSSVLGFVSLYGKAAVARAQLVSAFGNNAGLKFLLGAPDQLGTVGGFTAWRALGTMVLIGGVWMVLTATKQLRGSEESGQLELFLSGPTTPRRASLMIVGGLVSSLLVICIFVTLGTWAVGHDSQVRFSLSESLLYGLAAVAAPLELIAVGCVVSQLAPIRRRAAMYAAGFFGLSFLLRGIADVATSCRWLLDVSPLGWIEHVHPLTSNNWLWLLPIGAFFIVFTGLGVYLAGRRDLGASLLMDNDSADPKPRLLTKLGLFSLRQTQGAMIGWWLGAAVIGFIYAYISKTAVDAFKSLSQNASQTIGRAATGHATQLSTETFMGIVFLLLMIMLMFQVTNALGNIREDEAEGYLDNIVVRPVRKGLWLSDRLILAAIAVIGACFWGTAAAWLGQALVHAGVPVSKLALAGVNILSAPVLMLGIGLLGLGYWPRLTTSAMYSVIAWSFLMSFVGGAINLNHWILDTSIMYHVALAPAVAINWQVDLVLIGIGTVLGAIGINRYLHRDIVLQ